MKIKTGARKLTGNNLKVAWVKFSKISWADFVMTVIAWQRKGTPTSRVANSDQGWTCWLKFVLE